MKILYLIRHGLPDFPDGKRMCLGSTDIPMGAEGLRQVEAMAAKLPPVTAVFSSPLIRAIQTARAIGLPVTVLQDLREMDMGEWDGLPFETIRVYYPELFAARGTEPTLLPPKAEDPMQALTRFRFALEQAAVQSPGDLAVIAHGGVIAQFLRSFSGQWRKPDYAEVIPIYWEEGRFFLPT